MVFGDVGESGQQRLMENLQMQGILIPRTEAYMKVRRSYEG